MACGGRPCNTYILPQWQFLLGRKLCLCTSEMTSHTRSILQPSHCPRTKLHTSTPGHLHPLYAVVVILGRIMRHARPSVSQSVCLSFYLSVTPGLLTRTVKNAPVHVVKKHRCKCFLWQYLTCMRTKI